MTTEELNELLTRFGTAKIKSFQSFSTVNDNLFSWKQFFCKVALTISDPSFFLGVSGEGGGGGEAESARGPYLQNE